MCNNKRVIFQERSTAHWAGKVLIITASYVIWHWSWVLKCRVYWSRQWLVIVAGVGDKTSLSQVDFVTTDRSPIHSQYLH